MPPRNGSALPDLGQAVGRPIRNIRSTYGTSAFEGKADRTHAQRKSANSQAQTFTASDGISACGLGQCAGDLSRTTKHPLERRRDREPEEIADSERIVRGFGRWVATKQSAAIRGESGHELPGELLRQVRARELGK